MLYPLIFKPIYKEVIWGGSRILPYKGIPADSRKIGESWELSCVKGNFSIVANGCLAEKTIDVLINEYGERLLGAKVIRQYGNVLPLLIKFIDAQDNLSIQVHPDDNLAKIRHNSLGKTEMWYVINAAPDSILYSGFSQQTGRDELVHRINDRTLTDVMQKYDVKTGDVFFIPAGRVHAIGSGCLMAEIQQTSDVTYRIFDYNRKDKNGNERELHTDLAKDAIDYTLHPDYKTQYSPIENEAVNLVNCSHFTTNLLTINKSISRNLSSIDSFVIYICMEGRALLKDNKGNNIRIKQGQTVLIPAETESVSIDTELDSRLLETYIE